MPILAVGPRDQHSQLQFYAQGKDVASYLFIGVERAGDNKTKLPMQVPNDFTYLQDVDLQNLLNTELEATYESLAALGKPVSRLMIPELNELTLGYLFMQLMLGVIILADLLEVNAFDQPGVEDSKLRIKDKLTKAAHPDQLDLVDTQ